MAAESNRDVTETRQAQQIKQLVEPGASQTAVADRNSASFAGNQTSIPRSSNPQPIHYND